MIVTPWPLELFDFGGQTPTGSTTTPLPIIGELATALTTPDGSSESL